MKHAMGHFEYEARWRRGWQGLYRGAADWHFGGKMFNVTPSDDPACDTFGGQIERGTETIARAFEDIIRLQNAATAHRTSLSRAAGRKK